MKNQDRNWWAQRTSEWNQNFSQNPVRGPADLSAYLPTHLSLSLSYMSIQCAYMIYYFHTFFLDFRFQMEAQRFLLTHKAAEKTGHTCPIFWIWGCSSEFLASQQCLAFYRGNLNPDSVAPLLPERLFMLRHLHYLSGKRLSEALMEAFWGTSRTVARKRKWISCWVNWG